MSPPRLCQPARCGFVTTSFTRLLAVRCFVFVLSAYQPALRSFISFLISCSKIFLHHGRFTMFTGSPSCPGLDAVLPPGFRQVFMGRCSITWVQHGLALLVSCSGWDSRFPLTISISHESVGHPWSLTGPSATHGHRRFRRSSTFTHRSVGHR